MNTDLDSLETELLLAAIYRHYGYDFRDYAPASLKRRLRQFRKDEGLQTISALQELALHDPAAFRRLLHALSLHVTALFRDPPLFTAFRNRAVPLLRTYPSLNLWCAGCSAGEDVYSLAILLEEENLLDRSRLHATDMNEAILHQARAGRFPAAAVKEYEYNYRRAGGKKNLSDYLTRTDDQLVFSPRLLRNALFSQHNLVTDGPFNEFQVVFCRDLLIYFNPALQTRVQDVLYQSLAMFGYLVLGRRERLNFTPHASSYETVEAPLKLYRRIA